MASDRHGGSGACFAWDWAEVAKLAREQPFDVALALFSLHDQVNKAGIISRLREVIRQSGRILVVDLSSHDLPRLTRLLRRQLASPAGSHDPRPTPVMISEIATEAGLERESYQVHLPEVIFPGPSDIEEYLSMFGIFKGMDLPLGIDGDRSSEAKSRVTELLRELKYPFRDQRVFVSAVLRS